MDTLWLKRAAGALLSTFLDEEVRQGTLLSFAIWSMLNSQLIQSWKCFILARETQNANLKYMETEPRKWQVALVNAPGSVWKKTQEPL